MDLVCGIDVHKASVMVATSDGRPPVEVRRTPTALARLATKLVRDGVRCVVLEPSGGYERLVCEVMDRHQVPVMPVHPQRARAFATAQGLMAKDDPIDARMLAEYGQRMTPTPMRAPSPALRQLQDLVAKRQHYRTARTGHQTWLATPCLPITADDRHLMTILDRRIAQLDHEIAAVLAAHDDLAIAHRRLDSMPGIGPDTATLLLARLPELGRLSAKQLAALVGVAPYQQRSGKQPGHARTAGGRSHVRQGLWMPTMVAMRCNPTIAAFRRRLMARGTPGSVIMIACMHKLLTILNAMMRRAEVWSPHLAPSP